MRRLALITAILLIGAALRLHGLGSMLGMTHYDEAYYGVDALSLVAQPRFTPFFPGNFGRESLWMYLLAPSLAVFGAGSFGLRVVAVFTGILTLAAVYRLARQLLGERSALWSTAALAVLFWHVLASHEAFRALLFPLVGALAFAFLWQARRTDQPRHWIISGVLLGLLAYTYLAARLWLGLAGVMLVWWFVRGTRRGTVIAGAIAIIISLPLLIYLLTNPAAAGQRVEQVVVSDMPTLLSNVVAWLRVWTMEGAQDVVYNLPGRPLLDAPLTLLFVAGIVALLTIFRRRAFWLTLLVGASIAPALLTTEPLKWLRAIGLNVPLAIVLGAGALGIERAFGLLTKTVSSHQVTKSRMLYAAPLLLGCLLLLAATNTLRDFNQWVGSPDLFFPMEQHIYAGIDWLAGNTPSEAPVYFAPFALDHPVLRLREWRLGARPAGAFMPTECLVLNTSPAYYFTLPVYTPGFVEQLGAYASVTPVDTADPRYTIYKADPHAALPEDWTTLGARIAAENISPLPDSAVNGDTLGLTIAFRRVGAVDRPYTMFAHLYGVDEKVGIMLIGQDDQPICPGYPPALWRDDETIIQHYAIPVATDVHGEFTIGIGIYDSLTQERLPINADSTIQPIHRLRVN